MPKKTLEFEINEFFELWGEKELISFFADVFPLLELYNVDENDDWVRDAVGEDNTQNVRLIRTVYLLSKVADKHAGKLSRTNAYFKNIWQRIEKHNSESN